MEANERQAWLLLASRVEGDTAHLIRVAVEAMEDRRSIPVLRGPGETTPAGRTLRPGERMIDGQVFYSAEWLND